jgi:hypothetical protein
MSTAPDLMEWLATFGPYPDLDWKAWDRAVQQWQDQRREKLAADRLRVTADR